MKLFALTLMFAIALIATPGLAAPTYSQTQSGSVAFGNSDPVVLTFTGTPAAVTDATLTLIATGGELANNNKRLEQLKVEGDTHQTPGQTAGWFLPVNYLDGSGGVPSPVTIAMADMNSTYTTDGQVVVSVVRPGFIAGGTFDVTLEYDYIPEPASAALFGLGGLAMLARRRR